MLIVPFNSDPWRAFSTTLGGVEYRFECNYNERNGVWSFDLFDGNSLELLVAGVPILIGSDLLEPYALGIGSLYAVDVAAYFAAEESGVLPQATDAGADDLGERVKVYYLEPGESLL
jgi:hypothetical protein